MRRADAAILLSAVLAVTVPCHGAESRLIPVPKVTLYPGDPVSPSAIGLKRFIFPAGAEARFASDPSQLAGKSARRTLVAGKPIAFINLRNPDVVRQGQPAPAQFAGGGLSISAQLVPLQSGTAGDRIEARNSDTGRVVIAVIQADGSLLVGAP